ncbi:hypothetical protein HELRODRAFT_174167 [Helobdella robusta]|uniref:Ig-like domain-containing protein n=1 Tax=Helobdella robusta TaxID=6412 RepID=T1F7Q3_HELRO|nr:hypothetical protein HELRODRAFT_174167 [Helobdella robusta]ESO02761.1 hypothetical protein HELRODRAFT_174167 [Helobdella robusta]
MKVQESDEGAYECYATNTHGVIFSDPVNVQVKGRRIPPQFFDELPRDVFVEVGETREVACAATGNPTPRIKWLQIAKENRAETVLNQETSSENVLTLKNIRESMELSCVARQSLFSHHELTKLAQFSIAKSKFAVVGRLPSAAYPVPPRNVRATSVNSTSAKIEWIQESQHATNKPSPHQKQDYRPQQQQPRHHLGNTQALPVNVDHWYVIVQTVADNNIQTMNNKSVTATNQSDRIFHKWFSIKDLKPFTTYHARVVAVGGGGESNPSSPAQFTTQEEVPPATPGVKVQSNADDSSVLVQWSECNAINGAIKCINKHRCTCWVLVHTHKNYISRTFLSG